MVDGRVPDAPDDARLVLAIDGIVVGGSRFSTDSEGTGGQFSVLLPPGTLDEENDVRAALLVGDEVRELSLS